MSLNPHQRNKVDISSMTEEEQKLFRLYGKLPSHKNLLHNQLKERKFFDSGDYALSKAGKGPPQAVGTAIPSPDTIPHKSPESISIAAGVSAAGVSSPISPIGGAGVGSPGVGGGGGILGTSPTSSTHPSHLGPNAGGVKEPTPMAKETAPADDPGAGAATAAATMEGDAAPAPAPEAEAAAPEVAMDES